MSGEDNDSLQLFLKAVAFAARAHQGQLRKDDRTPYVSHVYRVCMILRDVFGIDDRRAMAAAVLHDTLEDTTTDFDDLEESFDSEIAGWVAALSKDGRLPYDDREAAYCNVLAEAPWQVQVCKLADIWDNLMDSVHLSEKQRKRGIGNKKQYLDAIQSNLKNEARQAFDMTLAIYAEQAANYV